MKINRFFEEKLGVKLKNPRWSWGGVNAVSGNMFLRVWEDQIHTDKDGDYVQVDWKQRMNQSPGYSERLKQVEAMKAGVQTLGVLCRAEDPNTSGKREIARFDSNRLLVLGPLKEDEAGFYAKIVGHLDLKDLARLQGEPSRLSVDVRNTLEDDSLDVTTKEALINARMGQGAFRTNVLQLWSNRCAVTGSQTLDAIRASHIKPWRTATNGERLDPRNGLPLVANIDALFDAGLVSFDSSGRLLVSPRLPPTERQIFDVSGKGLTRGLAKETAAFLEYHRSTIYQT